MSNAKLNAAKSATDLIPKSGAIGLGSGSTVAIFAEELGKRIAAKKVLGLETQDYTGTVPSNTLKVMDIDLTSVGRLRSEHDPPEKGFEEIRAVTPDGKVYKKFVIKDGRMIGAILLGSDTLFP